MFFREVGAGLHAEILLVYHGARNHVDCVLDWAHGMANSTPSTVFLYDLRERVVTIELDSLVSRVSAGKEAATALQAVIIVDLWN